jgi:hypothetical protein
MLSPSEGLQTRTNHLQIAHNPGIRQVALAGVELRLEEAESAQLRSVGPERP